MAKPSPEVCNKVDALLELGERPVDISKRLGVDYQAVVDLNSRRKHKKKEDNVKWAAKSDHQLIEDIVVEAKLKAPPQVVKKLDRIHEGITGLQKLEGQFHTTMTSALEKADEFLEKDDLKPAEWVAIVNSLAMAYKNIFNESGVSVNVNNGQQFSSDKLQMFKGAMRD